MSHQKLPRHLQDFLSRNVASVVELELLLMLHASAPRAWDAAELAQELRIDSAWAASRAELLCERGLIHCEADPVRRYSYHPASSQLDQEVKDLAAVYADQRVSIISFIYSRPPDQLRLFSDAFRLRKEQNDE